MRRIDACITQRKAQGPYRTCNESKEERRKRVSSATSGSVSNTTPGSVSNMTSGSGSNKTSGVVSINTAGLNTAVVGGAPGSPRKLQATMPHSHRFQAKRGQLKIFEGLSRQSPRPEFGLDCLICAIFAQQRTECSKDHQCTCTRDLMGKGLTFQNFDVMQFTTQHDRY